MVTLNTYINFPGNTEEAFNFYKSVFGGEFTPLMRYKDMPPSEGQKISESDSNKIMHVSLPIGRDNVLMGTDALESMGHKMSTGTNMTLSVAVESEAEADKVFNALAVGGKVGAAMSHQFWGYWGMLTDKFGIQWMVNFDHNKK